MFAVYPIETTLSRKTIITGIKFLQTMAEPYLTQLQQFIAQLGPLSTGSVILEAKHFFSGAALYADGKICASLSPVGFALKLPQKTRLDLIANGKGSQFRFFPNGPIKVDYVSLSNSVLEDERQFQELFALSIDYVTGRIDQNPSPEN